HTRNVAAGTCEARYKPGAHRVGGKDHNNRDGRRCTLGSDGSGGRFSDDNIGFQRHEFGGKAREALVLAFHPSPIKGDVLSLDVAEIAQGRAEESGSPGW